MSKRGLWIAVVLFAGLCAEAASERFADSVAFDAALSWVGSPGHFTCPAAYSNDTYRYTLDLIAGTGVTHVRERNRWREIAPTPDAWTPGRYLDNAKMAEARGIRLGGMFHDAPPYARPDTMLPRDLLATYRFCKRLAETLGDRMEMWEFWNEQDIGSTDEGAWDYAAAMKAAALGFRAGGFKGLIAPGALCRDDSGAYDVAMAENDPFVYADVANFHCYEPTSQYDAHLEMRRRYLRKIGFGHLPIVLTECGTRQEGMSATPSISKGVMAHSPEQESVQSEFVVKSQILSRMVGVLRNYFFVFGAYNEFGGKKDWGLIRRDGTPKPAVGAFRRLIAEVGDGVLAGEIAVAGGKVRAFRFDMPDGRVKVAYWRRTGLDDGTAEIKDHSDPAEPFALRLEDGREVRLVAHREAAYATLPGPVAVSVRPRPTGTPGARTDPSLDTTVVIRADYDKSQVVLGNNKSRLEMKGEALDLTVEVWNLDTVEKTGRIDFAGVGRVEGIPETVRLPALGKVSFPVRYRLAESGGEPRFALVGAFGGRRTTRLVIPLLSEMAYARACTVVETGWKDLSRWTKNSSAPSVDISWDEKENAVRMRHRWTAKDYPDRWFFNRFRLDLPKESLANGRYLVFEVKSVQDKVENDYNSARVFFRGKSIRYLTHFPPVSGWETRIVDIRPETREDGVTELQFGAHPRGYDVTYWIRNVRIFNVRKACDIAAFVWPAYQPEPRWAELGIFKDGKGEWQNVYENVKRFDDDLAELRPLWGFEDEADPKVVERKIDTAVKYGVNVFIYDWYWYGGRPFLADALEKGFLGARNNRKMKFFVMWANHNVTHLWDNTVGRAHKKDVLWKTDVSDEDYAKIVETWIGYFKQPNYYRIDGKPVLCIYLEPRFLERGEETAKARIALLRKRAAEEGFPGVHLMANGRPTADLGYDSMTVYNWGFAGAGDRVESRTEPPLDFDAFADLGFSLMDRDFGAARKKGISYFPNLTIGWDNNARFPSAETNNIVHGTSPESFGRAARRLKEWMASHRNPKGPQLLTVNSWNEWTEGSYLEPSDRLGFSFLEVLRRTFGEPLRVSVDGTPLKVEEARCSAVRKNRRWPGFQRPKGETEICSFVRFDMDRPREVEVVTPFDFTNVVVKPLSRHVKVVRDGRRITLTVPAPGGYSVEFDGFHENLHVFADPVSLERAGQKDPSVRWFGPGEHDVGPIVLKSGETLYLEDGAVVYGRVFARDAHDIRILGRGILDASRVKEEYIRNDPAKDAEERAKKFAVANVKRYDTIRLEFCDRVKIEGITIRDSQIYNIRPIGCRDVEIAWVKTVGNWRYNSDGFDLHNCERVRIHDCFIRTFDDAICIKGWDCWMDEREMDHNGRRHDFFSDVLVERCTIWNDWGKALEIGAETRAREIRDVVFRDCDVIRTSGAALDIDNVDYADVHDVTWDDIRVEYDPVPTGPLLLSLRVVQHPEYSAGGTRRGKIRDILFRNIRVTGSEMPVSGLRGHSADAAVRNVRIENLTFNGKKIGSVREMNLSVQDFADEPVFDDCQALPSPSYGKSAGFEWTQDGGVSVKGRVCGSYLFPSGILTELSVDVPTPRPGSSVDVRMKRQPLVKLLSELPGGWTSRFERDDCVLTVPADRSRRSYPQDAVLPKPQDVPELLRAEDGRTIATREEWERIRRPEIRRYFCEHVYGRRPFERPPCLHFEPAEPDRVMMDGAAVRKRIRVTYGGPFATNSFVFTAFVPRRVKKPSPSFLLICNRNPAKNIDPDRKEKSDFWPAEEIVRRGFAAVAFYNGDVAPDYVHGNTVGAFAAFEDVRRPYRDQSSWGLLSCWGWGASRVLDWIETEPTLDAGRVAVVGHSRGGKTALLAAALDERFAMACVNDSGCCGMKLNHIDLPASERPLHTIRNRQNWYCLNFTEFANREREMPYDMHCLAALIAPRKLCVASAGDDSEAGPLGEFWSARLASPAWELYGKRGLVSSEAFPPIGRPLREGSISYRVRPGGHDLTADDWKVYMDFFEHE